MDEDEVASSAEKNKGSTFHRNETIIHDRKSASIFVRLKAHRKALRIRGNDD